MNILIIGSHYASSSSANGICAQNLALEFKRQGHDVCVISTGLKDNLTPELIEGVKVWTIKIEWFNQLLVKLQKGAKWYHRLLLKFVAKSFKITVDAMKHGLKRIYIEKSKKDDL